MISKIDITDIRSFEYVREQLLLGGKTLSQLLCSLNLENGRVFSLVPEGISNEALYAFESGSIYPQVSPSAENKFLVPIRNDAVPYVIEFIQNYLKGVDNCCIFEEANGSANDPWITQSQMEHLSLGHELYYYFDSLNSNEQNIEKALRTSDGYCFLCALGSLRDQVRALLHSGGEFPLITMQEFATNVRMILVKAYDHEGYLLWQAI